MKRNIMEQWQEATELVAKLAGITKKQPELKLIEMIEQAKREWQIALNQLDFCDQDMLDSIVHEIQAKERRYMALLQQARKENIIAWPVSCESSVGSSQSDTSTKERKRNFEHN